MIPGRMFARPRVFARQTSNQQPYVMDAPEGHPMRKFFDLIPEEGGASPLQPAPAPAPFPGSDQFLPARGASPLTDFDKGIYRTPTFVPPSPDAPLRQNHLLQSVEYRQGASPLKQNSPPVSSGPAPQKQNPSPMLGGGALSDVFRKAFTLVSNGYDGRVTGSPLSQPDLEVQVDYDRHQQAMFRPGGEQMASRFGQGSPLTASQPVYSRGQEAAYGAAAQRALDADVGTTASIRPQWDDTAGREEWTRKRHQRMRDQDLTQESDGQSYNYTKPDGTIVGTNRLGALLNAQKQDPGNQELARLIREERGMQMSRTQQRKDLYDSFQSSRDQVAAKRDRAEARRSEQKYNRALRQGLNPNSPLAAAEFPEQTARLREAAVAARNGTSPLSNPEEYAKPTPEGQGQADDVINGLLHGIPPTLSPDGKQVVSPGAPGDSFLSAERSGLTGEETDVSQFHTYLDTQLQDGVELGPQHVRSMRAYLLALKNRRGASKTPYLPSRESEFGIPQREGFERVYQVLTEMPEDSPDEHFSRWLEGWRYARKTTNTEYEKLVPPLGSSPIALPM
jgi:hypothetical protein